MNKARGGDGIPVELFQILKDDAVKVLHSICQQIYKTQQWSQDWKRSVVILIPKKSYANECSSYRTAAAASLQSCPTLCDPIDGSQPGSAIPGILQARTLEFFSSSSPKLPHSCTHLTGQQSNVKNSPSQASIVCELRTSRCSSWVRKGRGTRNQIVNIRSIIENAREFQKNIYFCFIDCVKVFDCVNHNKTGKFLKRCGYQTTLPPS